MFTILLIHLAGLASPGPDFFYVVRQSAGHSNRAGVLAAIGIALGIIFWAGFAIFGLAWLNNSIGAIFQYMVMLVGGCYLAYIGSKMVRVMKNATFQNDLQNLTELRPLTEIKKGLLINLFNAKAGVYFTSVVSAFIGNFKENSDLFILLLLFVISTLIYFVIVAVLFSRKPVQQFYSKYSRYIDNVAGLIFICFGLMLIYEGISYLI